MNNKIQLIYSFKNYIDLSDAGGTSYILFYVHTCIYKIIVCNSRCCMSIMFVGKFGYEYSLIVST